MVEEQVLSRVLIDLPFLHRVDCPEGRSKRPGQEASESLELKIKASQEEADQDGGDRGLRLRGGDQRGGDQ